MVACIVLFIVLLDTYINLFMYLVKAVSIEWTMNTEHSKNIEDETALSTKRYNHYKTGSRDKRLQQLH